MMDAVVLERISQLQDEILRFTWDQVAGRVDTFYVQGKVSDDESGQVLMVSGDMLCGARDGRFLKNSEVLTDEEFDANSEYICPRIEELHDLLFASQGRSPVRFRWMVDTRTGRVESDWTYYEDLTDAERKDDFWEGWKGDFAWMDEIRAHLLAAQPATPPRSGSERAEESP